MTSAPATSLDLAVVGSGGAAMAAAIHARQRGATVVLVERATLGGTCVNVGCVPSKTLLAAAGTRHGAVTNPFRGAPTWADAVGFGALVEQKDELVARLRQHKYADVAAAYGFEVRAGHARFTDADTLLVNGQPLPARAYLIATGAEPTVPDLPGLAEVDFLTSTTAMELAELPESLVVVGGGYVGGAAVVVTETGQRLAAQRVLVAVGRNPRTAELNLAAAGVKTDERGFVVVDAEQRTSNPQVFAAGDVTGAPQYVYVAAAAGKAAAINALGGAERLDYTGLPAVTFTRPQLATAGLTEADALAQGHRCGCRLLDLADVPRALANRDTRGAIKLVADADTGRVLGVHALADGAGDMMLAATYAIKAGFTVDDLAETWAPYLTMAEGLRLVAGLFRNQLPTSCCA